jgi:hypothetical protein
MSFTIVFADALETRMALLFPPHFVAQAVQLI